MIVTGRSIRTFESVCQPFGVDGELPDFHSGELSLGFECKLKNSAPVSDDLPLLPFHGSDRLEAKFVHAMRIPGYLDSGYVKLDNYLLLGNCALPVNHRNSEIIIGEALCWGRDFAKWYMENAEILSWLERFKSEKLIDKTITDLKLTSISGQCYIFSAPGQEIYGHWIIDVLPKLYITSQFGSPSIPKYYANLPKWASPFLNAFGYAQSDFLRHPSLALAIENAIIPTGAKSGFRLGREALLASWNCAAQSILTAAGKSKKVFLSRSRWPEATGRSLSNRREVEARAKLRGYEIVHPETLSIEEQVNLMRHASIVIGEDGSALHNIVFANSDCRLGVLNPAGRDNLWHLSICQILRNKIAYCDIPDPKVGPLPISLFDDFIDCLEGL